MNDCLAATGSAGGIDPIIGALALLLLGAGIAVLVWRNRRRGAAGIALLPLVLGILLFSGLSGQPAQAAPCPPPAECVPTTVVDDVLIAEDVLIGLESVDDLVGIAPDLDPDQWAAFADFFDAVFVAGPTGPGTSVLTLTNGTDTVVLYGDEDGYIESADPALPADFTLGDVWDLVYDELGFTDIDAELVIALGYDNGCADSVATATIRGSWVAPIP